MVKCVAICGDTDKGNEVGGSSAHSMLPAGERMDGQSRSFTTARAWPSIVCVVHLSHATTGVATADTDNVENVGLRIQ